MAGVLPLERGGRRGCRVLRLSLRHVMSIRRERLEAGQIDLSDVTDGARLAPVHPGDVLKHDYMGPLGMSVYGLRRAPGRSPSRVIGNVQGGRSGPGVTA